MFAYFCVHGDSHLKTSNLNSSALFEPVSVQVAQGDGICPGYCVLTSGAELPGNLSPSVFNSSTYNYKHTVKSTKNYDDL